MPPPLLNPCPRPLPCLPQVSFLMNNLTADNMPQKSKELANVVLPKYVEWFANYLVVRRAAQVRGTHSNSPLGALWG